MFVFVVYFVKFFFFFQWYSLVCFVFFVDFLFVEVVVNFEFLSFGALLVASCFLWLFNASVVVVVVFV